MTALTALVALYDRTYRRFGRVNEALVLLQGAKNAGLSDEAVKGLAEIAERRVRGHVERDLKERYRSYWWAMGVLFAEALVFGIGTAFERRWSFYWFFGIISACLAFICALLIPFVRRRAMSFEEEGRVKNKLSK